MKKIMVKILARKRKKTMVKISVSKERKVGRLMWLEEMRVF